MNRYRRILDSVTEFAIVAMDRDGLITDWNTGAERILGWSAAEMVGEEASRFFTPEDRAASRLFQEMAAAVAQGRGIDERWHLRRDGSRFWASGEMMPLRDDDGTHVGYVKILRDRTEQHQAGRALAESRSQLEASEAKWRGLFENLQEGFLLGEVVRDAAGRIVDWRYEQVNRAWGDLVGIAPETVIGRTLREVIPGAEPEWVSEFADVVESGRAVHFTRQVGALGRWYDGVCQPAEGDRFTVIFLEVTDRVARQRRQEALLDLAVKLRDLDSVERINRAAGEIVGLALGASRVGFGLVDIEHEVVDMRGSWHADGVAAIEGTYRFRDFGSFIEDLKRGEEVIVLDTHRDPRTRDHSESFDAISVRTLVNLPIMAHGQLVAVPYVHYGEPRVWTDADTDFLRGIADQTQAAVARVKAEAERAFLNHELAHRLKNNLALVQSIVTQTLRTATDIPSARKTLVDRIQALSKAHEILLTGQRDAASISEIVRSATALHDQSGRVRISGADIALGPKASLTLSLIVHELSTNAAKYGALSVAEGHVAVEWSVAVDPGAPRPRLLFEWREIGGPPVSEPTKRSFGTRLIAMGLSGAAEGTSEIDYAPDGLRCRITASLTELQADEAATARD